MNVGLNVLAKVLSKGKRHFILLFSVITVMSHKTGNK